MTVLHGFTDGQVVIASTDPQSGQATPYPWPRFLEEAKSASDVRLAILHPSTVYKSFPATANEQEITAGFETGFVLSLRRLSDPDIVLAAAVDRELVIEAYRLLPNLTVLTDPAIAARLAIATLIKLASGSRIILADVYKGETILFVYNGEAVLKTRRVETATLAREIQQTIGSFSWRWEPGTDLIATTDQEAMRALEEWFGSVTLIPKHPVLHGLAAAHPDRIQRWITPKMAEDARKRQERSTRFKLMAVTGAGLAAAAAIALFTLTHSAAISRQANLLAERLAAIKAQAGQTIASRLPTITRASQPDWQRLLLELAQATPRHVRVSSLKIFRDGGSTWTLEATLEPLVLDETQANALIGALQTNAKDLALLSNARIEKSLLQTGLGARMTMQMRGAALLTTSAASPLSGRARNNLPDPWETAARGAREDL